MIAWKLHIITSISCRRYSFPSRLGGRTRWFFLYRSQWSEPHGACAIGETLETSKRVKRERITRAASGKGSEATSLPSLRRGISSDFGWTNGFQSVGEGRRRAGRGVTSEELEEREEKEGEEEGRGIDSNKRGRPLTRRLNMAAAVMIVVHLSGTNERAMNEWTNVRSTN